MTRASPQIDHIVVVVPDLDAAAAHYERLGFTLTPRAQHPWGTANRLVQLAEHNFIELLEIDRPELIPPPRPGSGPSFGRFAAGFLSACGPGLAGLVLASEDAEADVRRFAEAGVATAEPFHFERKATLPDGRIVTVAFSLAFAVSPAIPHGLFFTCHNRFPENFWKDAYRRHGNGATGMREVVMVAAEPAAHASFAAGFTASAPRAVDGGLTLACGPHAFSILTPDAFSRRFAGLAAPPLSEGPRLAAVVIAATGDGPELTPAPEAAGVAIAWQRPGR